MFLIDAAGVAIKNAAVRAGLTALEFMFCFQYRALGRPLENAVVRAGLAALGFIFIFHSVARAPLKNAGGCAGLTALLLTLSLRAERGNLRRGYHQQIAASRSLLAMTGFLITSVILEFAFGKAPGIS